MAISVRLRLWALLGVATAAPVTSAWAASVASTRVEPLSREGAVTVALENNPEVLAARASWQQLLALTRGTWAPTSPELSLEFDGLASPARVNDFAERNIGLTQGFGTPWKWVNSRRAASAEAEAARALVYEQARLDVACRVRLAYDELLSRRQILQWKIEQQTLVQDFADKAAARLRAGDIAELAALRAEVEAGRAVNHVTAARQEVVAAQDRLNALLGRDGAEPTETIDTLEVASIDRSLDDLRRLALASRPDLLGHRQLAKLRQAERRVRAAELWPDMRVGVFRQTSRDPVGTQDLWRVGIGLDLPLWGAQQQRSQLAAAGARVVQASAEEAALRRQVQLDVDVAYGHLVTASRQIALFNDSVLALALQAHEVVARSHAEGKSSYLEVIDVQRTLLETRVEYANVLLSYRQALVNLDRATGGQLINGEDHR